MSDARLTRRGKIIIIAAAILLALPLVVMPVATVIIYESIFGSRYETAPWLEFSTEDYEGLTVSRSDFDSEGERLAGYKYTRGGELRGVVVISHGLGGGGHNSYMPFIDFFTQHGYGVFAYDAHGNDNSEGRGVEGLPQGVIDLDRAIDHLSNIDEFRSLPIALFGHSWGGYSVGNVLSLHPEVRAAIIVAGFNESEDMLLYQAREYVGSFADLTIGYLELYERLKFGSEYSELSALSGMAATDAGIMIVHSADDETVPVRYGYDKFHEAYADSERFQFVRYEDRGHNYLFYSEAAWEYREQLNADYRAFVEDGGREYSAETKLEFMTEHLDKKWCFELDPELASQMLALLERELKSTPQSGCSVKFDLSVK